MVTVLLLPPLSSPPLPFLRRIQEANLFHNRSSTDRIAVSRMGVRFLAASGISERSTPATPMESRPMSFRCDVERASNPVRLRMAR